MKNSSRPNPLMSRIKRTDTISSINSPSMRPKSESRRRSRSGNVNYEANVFNWNQNRNLTKTKEITNLSLKVSGLINNKINLSRSTRPFALIEDVDFRKNEDLYFLVENRNQLPNDIVLLTKLNLIKDETVDNFRSGIRKMEKNINGNQGPVDSRLELSLNRVELEFQNNVHDMNYKQINYDDLLFKVTETGWSCAPNGRKESPKFHDEVFWEEHCRFDE